MIRLQVLIFHLTAYWIPTAGSTCGIPLGLVLDACRILANIEDGCLTLLEPANAPRLTSATPDALLRPDQYKYYIICSLPTSKKYAFRVFDLWF